MNTILDLATPENLTLWGKIIKNIYGIFSPFIQQKIDELAQEEKIKTELSEVNDALTLITDHPQVPIKFKTEKWEIDTTDWDQFSQRISMLGNSKDLVREQNLKSVLKMAQEYSGRTIALTNDSISEEWGMRFISNAECVFDNTLQSIWAKVLTGEVQHPGSISLRTLDVLKNLSKHEAELFQQILPLVFMRESECFLWASGAVLKDFKIYYRDILLLDECGLIQSGNTTISFTSSAECSYANSFHNSKELIRFDIPQDVERIRYQSFPLTSVGKQLYHLLRNEPNDAFLTSVITSITEDTKACGVKLYKYTYSGDGRTFIHDESFFIEYCCAKKPTTTDPLNINNADSSQLMTLEGIGKVYAERILQYRQENGSFKTIEDLMKVKGIGELRFNGIKDVIVV